jgi:hypothetical protein
MYTGIKSVSFNKNIPIIPETPTAPDKNTPVYVRAAKRPIRQAKL